MRIALLMLLVTTWFLACGSSNKCSNECEQTCAALGCECQEETGEECKCKCG